MKLLLLLLLPGTLLFSNPARSQDVSFKQQEVIYDHKDGMALTMMVLTPAKPIGKAVISVVSGGWFSGMALLPSFVRAAGPFMNAGYTVFLVMHGSGPRYAMDEAVHDIHRAVQFIRYNARNYSIDSSRIGITGTSSGGHLSLMAGAADDIRNEGSPEPMSRVSSKVQAVAAFCPPSDLLNWGAPGIKPSRLNTFLRQQNVVGAFEFKTFDPVQKSVVAIQDTLMIDSLLKTMSPGQLLTADDPPVFIMHGDQDHTVPLQQSLTFEQKMKQANLPVMLVVKKGADHGWNSMLTDEGEFVKWFDRYLK